MSEYEDPKMVPHFAREYAIDYIASGIDPKRSVIFVQSDVPQHAELHLLLSTITPLGWLERCPTYKEQQEEIKDKDLNTYAFLGYPVLQTADIIIYRADYVPVGDDQLPHIEIAREIARRFNHLYGSVFPEPQALLSKTPRLLGLDRRKMSKSYGNFIALADPPEVIKEKVAGMFTDPERKRKSDPGRPEFCNVHTYYEIFAPDEAPEVAEKCRKALWGCTECKARLAERLLEYLAPLISKRNELMENPELVTQVLKEGAEKAQEAAEATMREVRRAIFGG
jgi:tryptophanyl-tRNA synthetase